METCGSSWLWKRFLLSSLFLFVFSTIGSSSHQTSSAIRFKLAQAADAERQVMMRAGAPFKVALFADLHFGEDAWTDWGPLQDVNSINVMNTVLHHETPGQLLLLIPLFLNFWLSLIITKSTRVILVNSYIFHVDTYSYIFWLSHWFITKITHETLGFLVLNELHVTHLSFIIFKYI